MAERSCHGDNAAFRRLAAELHPMLVAACSDLYAPGLEFDDFMQEALIGLAKACEDFDPAGGSGFAGFAQLCARRRTITALKLAQRQKHRPVNQAVGLDAPIGGQDVEGGGGTLAEVIADPRPRDPVEVLSLKDELATYRERAWSLSELEVAALGGVAGGESYEAIAAAEGSTVKRVDNALQRARRKVAGLPRRERKQQDEEVEVTTETFEGISAPVDEIDLAIELKEGELAVLRELRAEAVAFVERVERTLNGGPTSAATAPAPAAPEPVPPEPPKPKPKPKPKGGSKPSDGGGSPAQVAARRAEELAELLKRQGPMSQKELAETTGWGSDSVVRCLQRLANDGRAHPTGGKRGGGRGSPEWAAGKEGSDSPEQWASVSTTDGAEATENHGSTMVGSGGEGPTEAAAGLDVDDQERDVEPGSDGQTDGDPWVNVPEPDEPDRKLTSQERGGRVQAGIVAGNEGLARRIEEACTLERRTIAEIAELLGEDKRLVGQMVKAMERVGRIETRGGKPVGSQLMACYQRRLRPEEDPTITIRQADRTGSLEARILRHLEDGRLTVEQLAAKVVLHPRLVAQAVSTLRGEGRVEKVPGGAYQLAEDTRAAA